MLDYLKQNISWLKDLFTLLFVGTGTVVAILTYRRARATILQPIRTEVIKRQSELLSRLLQLLKENNHSFEVGLDYLGLVQANVLMTLKDCGFVFKQNAEIEDRLENTVVGWIPCGKSNILKDVEVIGTFTNMAELLLSDDYGKEKFTKLQNQQIDVDKIYLTKSHSDFAKTIAEFKNDPFMPTNVQQTLNELLNDIHNNLSIILKSELEIFLFDFGKIYFEKNKAPNFDPVGVYNSFNHSRVHHREAFNKLRNEIRKYLRIDEVW